ncbi:DUF2182 domain-containing protein [Aestuariibius sp. HNIBRBA575]|uniref:DUF2182 domain-containing protein n=1 Tax=Aestuariibius sp. HNIBRBA575 TaxID=3233343 RepID=UPI0034A48586
MRDVINLRAVLWLSFFASILVAWGAVFGMIRASGLDYSGRSFWDLCLSSEAGFGGLTIMWMIMMAAMMLPTMVPTLKVYDDLITRGAGSRGGWIGVLAGYAVVWALASIGFAGLQVALARAGITDDLGRAQSIWFAVTLLIVAGAYQLSQTKAACQDVCRTPTMYFLGHWRAGATGGLRMGAELGLVCVGCCWAIMGLAFVGGAMSLIWMGLATVFMVIEKLPDVGRFARQPVGFGLIFVGVLVAALHITEHIIGG